MQRAAVSEHQDRVREAPRPMVRRQVHQPDHDALRHMSANQLAALHADTFEVAMVLTDLLAAFDDPDWYSTPEQVVRRLGWCKAVRVWPFLFPKTQLATPGSLHVELVACGKPNCRCVDGDRDSLHQSVRHVWWDGKRLRRE